MEQEKHIIQRFVEELWNARKLDVADQIFSEDCVTHQLRSGAPWPNLPLVARRQ
jgi:hypothetical protein